MNRKHTNRHYSLWDKLTLSVDQTLRALTDNAKTSGAPNPAAGIDAGTLTDEERKAASSLMRVNHAGEICAQALYHGQALASRESEVQANMQQAAIEEGDHLAWCKGRLDELGSHTSYLNPIWYAGSFVIGMVAGMIGDKWSLGFVAETEHQVIKHLKGHLNNLPVNDLKSVKILEQMERDENKHREEAIAAGARELPEIIKKLMALTSKFMVKTAYYI